MKILVISDTHIPVTSRILPKKILEEAKGCAVCLHAGDFVNYTVFKNLGVLTNVYGVCGNMDSDEIKKALPMKQVVELEGIRVGLTHGSGAPARLIYSVQETFAGELSTIDIFVFGHSHNPLDQIIKGKIYFNPGSPTDKVFSPYNSYGIIEVQDRKIQRRLIRLE